MSTVTPKEISLEDFITYLRKDLVWLEGFADGTESEILKRKVEKIRRDINQFERGQDPNCYPLEINKEAFLKP